MTNLHFWILLGLASFVLADPTDDAEAALISRIFIRLYGRNGNHTDEYLKNAVNLVSKMDNSTNTTFYIPGYLESLDSSISTYYITNAYLNDTNHNVLALDYRLIEYNLYPVGVDMTDEIGKAVAAALEEMIAAGIAIEKWNVIGFSLGAQIAGVMGGNMSSTLPIITGLDPAGPLFTFVQRHLKSTDAKFVMVIHGDMGAYGTALQLGQVDFYPNLGKNPQPGCPTLGLPYLVGDVCSHNKVPMIYAATVDHPELFIGLSCDSDEDFISGACDSNGTALMGYGTPSNTSGKYYLMTSALYPYGKGIEGTSYS